MSLSRRIGWAVAATSLAALPVACVQRSLPPAPVVSGDGGQRSGSSQGYAAPAGAARIAAVHPKEVTLQSGETLYTVSRRYDVPVRSLIDANALSPPYALPAGRTLALPEQQHHAVQPGETLYSISRLYGVDTTTLARVNGLRAPFVVETGQRLVLPTETKGAKG